MTTLPLPSEGMPERRAALSDADLEKMAARVGDHLQAALGQRQAVLEEKLDRMVESVGSLGSDMAVNNERVLTHFQIDKARHEQHDKEFRAVWIALGKLDGRFQPLEDKRLIQDTLLRLGNKGLLLIGGIALAALGALASAIWQQLRIIFGW